MDSVTPTFFCAKIHIWYSRGVFVPNLRKIHGVQIARSHYLKWAKLCICETCTTTLCVNNLNTTLSFLRAYFDSSKSIIPQKRTGTCYITTSFLKTGENSIPHYITGLKYGNFRNWNLIFGTWQNFIIPQVIKGNFLLRNYEYKYTYWWHSMENFAGDLFLESDFVINSPNSINII